MHAASHADQGRGGACKGSSGEVWLAHLIGSRNVGPRHNSSSAVVPQMVLSTASHLCLQHLTTHRGAKSCLECRSLGPFRSSAVRAGEAWKASGRCSRMAGMSSGMRARPGELDRSDGSPIILRSHCTGSAYAAARGVLQGASMGLQSPQDGHEQRCVAMFPSKPCQSKVANLRPAEAWTVDPPFFQWQGRSRLLRRGMGTLCIPIAWP
jgi:hypothetical protein